MAAKSRWFQCHLLTAIVLMFVAGGLIKLNLGHSQNNSDRLYGWPMLLNSQVEGIEIPLRIQASNSANPVPTLTVTLPVNTPITIPELKVEPAPTSVRRETMYETPNAQINNGIITYREPIAAASTVDVKMTSFQTRLQTHRSLQYVPYKPPFPWKAVTVDATISLAILLFTAIVVEFILRRREQFKQSAKISNSPRA